MFNKMIRKANGGSNLILSLEQPDDFLTEVEEKRLNIFFQYHLTDNKPMKNTMKTQ